MWTTSSFRAELLAAALLTACATAPAPDAPLPALPVERAKVPNRRVVLPPIEIASVRLRPVDAELARLAGPRFMREARRPIAVEVRTTAPLDIQARSASPVLYINGVMNTHTWMLIPDRLVAFVEDASTLRPENKVEAAWAGQESTTRSRTAVTFGRD